MNWNCNDDDKKKCTALAKRDLIYLCILFAFVIMFLMTITFGHCDDSNKLFSFASTLVSIVLSVIAIIMTIYSEYKNERAANSLSLAINAIDSASRKFGEQTDEQIRELKNINEKLRTEFDRINVKLDSIGRSINFYIPNNREIRSQWIQSSGERNE